METTVKQRLIAFIDFLGISQAEFQRRCNMASGFINNINKSIGTRTLMKIESEFPQLNTRWLITGQGPMTTSAPGVVQNNFSDNNNYLLGGSVNTLGAGGACCAECGTELIEVEEARKPIIPTEWTYQQDIDIYEKVQRDTHAVSRSRFIALDVPIDMWHIVRDDSLLPDAKRGDLIALSAYPIGCENPIPGKVHAVDTKSNGIIIRKLFFEDYGFRGLAPNPEFPDIRILHEDIIRVFRIVCLARIAL